MNLRVPCSRELDVDKGLLLIHHKRAGCKGKYIGPHIAACKEFIDPRDRIEICGSKARNKCTGLYHAPQFGHFINEAHCGLFYHLLGEQHKGLAGKEGGTVHGKPRMDERGPDGNQRVRSFEEAILHHDTVDMNKYFVNEPLPAGAGVGNIHIGRREALVQCPHAALRTGQEYGRKRGKDIFC
jgi:hypothetical protein